MKTTSPQSAPSPIAENRPLVGQFVIGIGQYFLRHRGVAIVAALIGGVLALNMIKGAASIVGGTGGSSRMTAEEAVRMVGHKGSQREAIEILLKDRRESVQLLLSSLDAIIGNEADPIDPITLSHLVGVRHALVAIGEPALAPCKNFERACNNEMRRLFGVVAELAVVGQGDPFMARKDIIGAVQYTLSETIREIEGEGA